MNDEIADRPSAWPLQFAKSLKGIVERQQRRKKVIEKLQVLEPQEIAEFLFQLTRYAGQFPHPLSELHLLVTTNLRMLGELNYETLSETYRIANEKNWWDVMVLLRSQRQIASLTEDLPEGFASKLDSLTLGERKQLSRQSDRQKLELLVFDSDPSVICNLLSNPRITETDVIRIASRQNAPSNVLEEVCASLRWNRNYRVRKTLVFNRNTPPSYAQSFAKHLRKEDLKILLQLHTVREEIQKFAREKLEEM